MKKILLLTTVFLFFMIPGINSQSLDSIRQIAWDGDYAKARELSMQQDDYSENTELLFLVGQTYYWENNLSEARKLMDSVVQKAPEHIQAYAILSSILLEAKEMREVVSVAGKGLALDPQNEDLLYNMAYARADQGHLKEAREDLSQLLSINPNNKKALELKKSMEGFKIPGSFGVYQSLQIYNVPFERKLWITTAEAPVGDKNIKIVPRFSFGDLQIDDQKQSGSQAGLDVYPLTGPNSYMYVHYAYSEAEIFPGHRSALEWFQGISKGWEISGGGRYLFWDDHNYFFTVSASKYAGKWMPGMRLFYAPQSDNSLTGVASVRKFFRDEKSFIHTYLSYGNNPDRTEQQINFMTDTKTTRIAGGAYTILKIAGPVYIRLLVEYSAEEYILDEWRNVLLGQVGLEYKF
jgi:YaiO family outer membrane protein